MASINFFDDYNDNATSDRYHAPEASDPSPATSSSNPFDDRMTTNMRPPSDPDDTQPSNDPPRPPDRSTGGSSSSGGSGTTSVEDELKKRLGSLYDPSILGDYVRNASYGAGNHADPANQDLINRIVNRNLLRGSNESGSTYVGSGGGGYTVGPTGKVNNPFGAPLRPVGSGQTAAAAAGSSSSGGAGGGSGARSNGARQFSDPASALMENYALDQFGNRINPNPNSGTALYEKYARELIDTLRQPVYSPQDEAILKTKFTDSLMRERDATKQRWLEELSARGIAPSSGPALDGLMKIEQHFEGLRTTAEAQFASDAIAQTRANRLQVLNTAGQLSQEEEARLQDAGNYARVPYDLADRAFQRNQQLVGAGGSPEALTSSALGIAGFQQNSALSRAQLALQQQAYGSGNTQAMTAALLQYLGYLFG